MLNDRIVNVYFDDGLNPVVYLGPLDMFPGQDIDVLTLEAIECYIDAREIDVTLIKGTLKGYNLILQIQSDFTFPPSDIIEKTTKPAPEHKSGRFENPSIAYD